LVLSAFFKSDNETVIYVRKSRYLP